MELFKIENLSFRYPKQSGYALSDINFTVSQGEFITICGKSGCGKSTLLRMLKTTLSPFGDVNGKIYFDGEELSSFSESVQASKIGFVMQSPENQIATDKVWHELAFGLESLGYQTPEIRARVSEMAAFFGINSWFYKNVTELSGGQKQLLNLASVLVMEPSVLILDEPTSQLDPIAAQEFFKTLEKINRELGISVILTEHRLEDAFPISDRVIVMDSGKIIADARPKEVGEILHAISHDIYDALPTPMRVYQAVENASDAPLTVRDGRRWLENYAKTHTLKKTFSVQEEVETKDSVIEIKDVWFRYEKNSPDIIKHLNLKIQKDEIFAIMGGNGTGKTTILSLICRLNKPYRGDIMINGQSVSTTQNLCGNILGVLPQNPQTLFVKNTVYNDLAEGLSDKKLSKSEIDVKIREISELCRIETLLENHPYDLSGGEQQRTALAKVLLTSPEVLLLDEPTKGMDAQFKDEFAIILNNLKNSGVTIVLVSHDIEFCAKHADRCALIFDGGVASVDAPREFFKGKSFYTTSANRMARTTLPHAILAEDIIIACGGEIKKKKNERRESEEKNKEVYTPTNTQKNKLSKATITSLIMLLITIPFTIFAGVHLFDDRKYYFISLLIILETFIPFYMLFERRKPQARELVIISVLCALAVAGRTAFFMLPQFKPVTALVIIAGMCLGGETGFLVGSITGFVSNFFFGQGPWTPWQMFAFGIIGFLSGILFKKQNKITLCLFGFLATVFIYGGIMNTSTLVMTQSKLNFDIISKVFLAGLPFDLTHALSTAFFLWVLAIPMAEKIERIKIKYGLLK